MLPVRRGALAGVVAVSDRRTPDATGLGLCNIAGACRAGPIARRTGERQGRKPQPSTPGWSTRCARLARRHSSQRVERGAVIASTPNFSAVRKGERTRSGRVQIPASRAAGSAAASRSARQAGTPPTQPFRVGRDRCRRPAIQPRQPGDNAGAPFAADFKPAAGVDHHNRQGRPVPPLCESCADQQARPAVRARSTCSGPAGGPVFPARPSHGPRAGGHGVHQCPAASPYHRAPACLPHRDPRKQRPQQPASAGGQQS